MKIENFIVNFAEQFDETEMNQFTADTVFKDLDEWDSMIALSIIAMVDEEYDLTINGDDIKGSKAIIDLFNAIESKQ